MENVLFKLFSPQKVKKYIRGELLQPAAPLNASQSLNMKYLRTARPFLLFILVLTV